MLCRGPAIAALVGAGQLLQLAPKGCNIVFADLACWDIEHAALGQHRPVAALEGGEDAYRFVAVSVGILHYGAVDVAVDDALQSGVFLVEGDDLDLASLAGFFDGFERQRRVVGKEADDTVEIGVFGDGVFDLGFGLGVVELIGARIEHGVFVAGDNPAVGVAALGVK